MKTFWISFATDAGCRGVVIADGLHAKQVYEAVTKMGLNPGGEVMIAEMDMTNDVAHRQIKQYGKNRLIPADELLKDPENKKLADLEETNAFNLNMNAQYVCEECNNDPSHAASHFN